MFKSTKTPYCSRECYWKDKPEKLASGQHIIRRSKIEVECTNCKKMIDVIPSNFNKTNKYGDNHNFCSHECYWKYRSKYYVGDKSIGKNRIWTEEQKIKNREHIIKQARVQERLESSIQKITNSILDDLGISYIREYIMRFYAIDNYLDKHGLAIEVMGDYWHASPLRYNETRLLSPRLSRSIHNDKAKHTFIINKYGIEVLYLWENDVLKRPDVCSALIQEYVKRMGKMDNYHSFNYSISADKLILNSTLIVPYQDMSIEAYKHLIKS